MAITSLSQLDPTKQYIYADYLTWQFEDERLKIELFDGYIKPWYSIILVHCIEKRLKNLQFMSFMV
jgi:hypothetical protein